MQYIYSFASVILLVSGLVGVDSLQCYVCDNCTSPAEADLKTCSDLGTTTAPPITLPTSPATQNTATPTTQGSTTQASSTEASTTQPSSTDASTTQSSTTQSSTTTQASIRSKRSVLSPRLDSESDGCRCRNEAGCECDDGLFSSRRLQYADIPLVCFKVTVKENNEDIIYRGCGPATIENKALCDTEYIVNTTTSCSTCSTDKCNGSFTIKYSAVLLLATIGFMLFK